MNITAAVAREPHGELSIEELSLEDPREDEVVVAITGVGLCHTDIAARDGVLPLAHPSVLGHEGAGVVVGIGTGVSKVRPGDHVAISFNSCGTCRSCAKGDPAYCHDFPALNYGGARLDGSSPLSSPDGPMTGNFFGQSSFASHAIANERTVVKVADDLPLALIGTLGCGIQTGAGAVMRSMACRAGSSLLVTGAGPVGLAGVMGAVVQGCEQIIVSEPHPARRELARSLGATATLDPTAREPLPEAVRAIAPAGVDYAFDTTGNVAVLESVIGCMAHRGVIGLVGVPSDFSAVLPLPIIPAMVLGLTVRGITEGDSDPHEFIPSLLELYREGRFPFDRMIETFPFTDINAAIAAQERGEVVKVVLVNGNH
jgi:aryl-alcohol dehydrogenase